MFIFMGLVPLASALTGWVLKYMPLPLLFSTCGLLLAMVTAIAWFASPMRKNDNKPPISQAV